MTTDGDAGRPYGISGYPTIKFFGLKKEKPQDYSSGDRTFEAFVKFCVDKVKQQVSERV
jgi:protein disulfide-isomerase A6